MTAYRLREYGSADWTEILLEGELEELAGELLIFALTPAEHLHVQRRDAEGDWEDVA